MTYPEPVYYDPMREYRWPRPETTQGTPIAPLDLSSLLTPHEKELLADSGMTAALGWCAPGDIQWAASEGR